MSEPSLPQESIFLHALSISSALERSRYLDKACQQNKELRSQVEGLLRAHAKSGDLLDLPEGIASTVEQLPVEHAGMQIGPYKLLQKIGEGGFGVVYMAEQSNPVRRKVALKVIKPGMDTREVIARFEAERQALALMNHPNIAKVLDGGTTDAGRPYFVMELVKGIPITQFCDDNKLDTHQRLRLFASVCRAIHHAHQKGIIHRDIKPSNVLVTLFDGVPVPRVIDFGVAKAISQQLTEKTMFTAYGQMIGTPQYMSPEQAEMSGLDIDTRSDIYSLGVLLYELLTGFTPLDPAKLRETAFRELQRMIREEEPPKPSTRISSSGQQSTSIASNRSTSIDRLGSLIRGDLDWIVMQTLEKSRDRRYESANALAADVERFLKQEPVEACPPSWGYRLRKYAQRNRQALIVLGSIHSLLVIGILVTSTLAIQMLRQRDRAHQKELAVLSVIQFLNEEFFDTRGRNQNRSVMAALEQLSSDPKTVFPEDPETEATLRHHLGVICHRAGLNEIAVQHLSRAHEIRSSILGDDDIETARTQYALAYAMLNLRNRFSHRGVQEANRRRMITLFPKMLETMEQKLGPSQLETLHAMAMQIFVYDFIGDQRQASRLYQIFRQRVPKDLDRASDTTYDPLDLIDSVFVLIHRDEIGLNPEVDEQIARQYELSCRDLPERDIRRIFWMGWYSLSLYLQGKVDLAIPIAEQNYVLRQEVMGKDNYLTFLMGRFLAAAKARSGDFDGAIELLEEILQREPQHAAQTLNLGVLYLQRNDAGDREKWLAKSNRMLDQFAESDNLVTVNFVLNLCLLSAPRSADEHAMQQRALALASRLHELKIDDIHNDAQDIGQHRALTAALAGYRSGDISSCQQSLSLLENGNIRMYRAMAFAIRAAITADDLSRADFNELIAQAENESENAPVWEIYTHQCFRWNRPYLLNFLIEEARELRADDDSI